MSGIILKTPLGGSVKLEAENTSTDFIMKVPAENATLLTLWLYLDNKGALPSTGQTCPRHNQGTMVDKVNHQPKRINHYPKVFFLWRCHTRRATTHDTVLLGSGQPPSTQVPAPPATGQPSRKVKK